MKPVQLVTVENRSTVVGFVEHSEIVQALNLQFQRDYNTCGWVRRGLAPPAIAKVLPEGEKPPAGAWNVIILDHSNQRGALGWHDDEHGTPIPYAEVFAVDAKGDGADVSAVCSHEGLEMLVDPFVDPMPPRTKMRPGTTSRYIIEVCDAVEGNDYDAGNGRKVADFVLPSWYGIGSFKPTSFRGSVTQPWQLAPRGYISIEKPDGSWTQVFGQERTSHPAWASRLPRIHQVVK